MSKFYLFKTKNVINYKTNQKKNVIKNEFRIYKFFNDNFSLEKVFIKKISLSYNIKIIKVKKSKKKKNFKL